MELKYGLISADDHVQEHPEVWTLRMSKQKWGDRIPHIERQPDGNDLWVLGGQKIKSSGLAAAGAVLSDRTQEPKRWEDVPPMVYNPRERLKAMDANGVDYSVLYPTIAGLAAETFGKLDDPDLELACVQAYNDWLIDYCQKVLQAFEEANARGDGSIAFGGQLIDRPIIERARRTLDMAKSLGMIN